MSLCGASLDFACRRQDDRGSIILMKPGRPAKKRSLQPVGDREEGIKGNKKGQRQATGNEEKRPTPRTIIIKQGLPPHPGPEGEQTEDVIMECIKVTSMETCALPI